MTVMKEGRKEGKKEGERERGRSVCVCGEAVLRNEPSVPDMDKNVCG